MRLLKRIKQVGPEVDKLYFGRMLKYTVDVSFFRLTWVHHNSPG
jgi:hypothetical protein